MGSTEAISLYKPENGATVDIAGGVLLNDWFGLQANYSWNRNALRITEASGLATIEQDRHSAQHAAIVSGLLFFRSRRSHIRPYLSAGSGLVVLRSSEAGPALGTLALPGEVDTVKLPLNVAVGIDLLFRHGWGFRYSFSETMTRNPFSSGLDPPGSRRLANFRNLFGFVKYF